MLYTASLTTFVREYHLWYVQGPRAVLGPGTGLGEAQLIWDDRFEGRHTWS